MPARKQTTFKDIKDINWRVTIDDSELSVPAVDLDFKLTDAFTLNYQGQNLERFNSVIPSKCSIGIEIESAADEVLRTDFVNSAEGRFKLLVERRERKIVFVDDVPTIVDEWENHWIGTFIADQVSYPDKFYPYSFSMTAIDQLSTLSKIDYAQTDGSVYEGAATFIEHLINILGKTNAAYFFDTGNDFLVTSCEWYDDNHNYSSVNRIDPLLVSRVNHIAFYDIDDDGNVVFSKCLKVLQQIAKTFGARFYQTAGTYRLEQINERGGGNAFVYRYNHEGTFLEQGSLSSVETLGHGDDMELMQGATYSYFPPLKSIVGKYNHESDRNLLAGGKWNKDLSQTPNLDTKLVVGSMVSDLLTTTLSFKANLYVKITFQDDIPSTTTWRWTWNLLVKYGTKYLKREITDDGFGGLSFSVTTWEDAVSYYQVTTGFISSAQTLNVSINFETPVLPLAEGILEIDFDYFSMHLQPAFNNSSSGEPYQPPPAPDLVLRQWELQNAILELFAEGTPADLSAVRTYQINNGDGATNTEVLTVETALGDALTNVTKVQIEVLNSSDEWVPSTQWSINQSGDTLPIVQLLLFEMMAGQKFATRQLRGAAYGPGTDFQTMLTRDGSSFLFMGGSFTASNSTWSAEWFELKLDRTNLFFGTTLDAGGSSSTGGVSGGGTGTVVVDNTPPVRENLLNQSGSTVTLTNDLPEDANRFLHAYRGSRLMILGEDFTKTGTNEITLTVPAMDEHFVFMIY